MCLVLVHVTMQCSNVSVPWVVEAFDNGFLSVLLKATEILKRLQGFGAIVGALKIAIEEIIGTVTEYMSYYSVVSTISTFRGRHKANRAMRAQESGPLKDKWVAFFNLIIERCMVQGLISARIRNVHTRCANVSTIHLLLYTISNSDLIGGVHRGGPSTEHAQMRGVFALILLLAPLPKKSMETR